MFKKGKSGNPVGRPKDSTLKKKISEIMKRVSQNKDPLNIESLARNEIVYHFNRYGLMPFSDAIKSFSEIEKTSGFEMIVLGLFKKCYEGDLKSTELILKLSGSIVDRVDHSTLGKEVDNKITVNFVKPDKINE